jgi:hypothetical protein
MQNYDFQRPWIDVDLQIIYDLKSSIHLAQGLKSQASTSATHSNPDTLCTLCKL